ncbi:hypothetical protein PVAP13_1KG266030 [Panicum virgatum]|uniref:Uncharacterized protein n=1 Tax=Panicum virgatum TaxID=38727 RepID=A0A8T0XJU2_PANVG|nr:hypothetical protein PVAP13_1KG266030 [Panicum virgatum]
MFRGGGSRNGGSGRHGGSDHRGGDACGCMFKDVVAQCPGLCFHEAIDLPFGNRMRRSIPNTDLIDGESTIVAVSFRAILIQFLVSLVLTCLGGEPFFTRDF